jgi:hypothetical protein
MHEGSWKEETKFLEKERIRHILGAPQNIDMGRWKEKAMKFIVSRYHQGYIWIDQPIAITSILIHHITNILKTRAKVPKSANTKD